MSTHEIHDFLTLAYSKLGGVKMGNLHT